ncbi:hypothetical protein ACFYVL_23580 [Streptomyces sp. NPDC004111]|uniref:hypothetical protein n=1 Tax=Streptomyces sp. NPDC004111 TaxID=3364690 RepID=UPI0036C6F611
MGWTVLYIAFGVVALWLLGEVLLQYKARLRWRVLAFAGFAVVVIGVLLPSVLVIGAGAVAFAVGQTYVTLSFRRGFSTGWAIGGNPGASKRRKGRGEAAEQQPTLQVSDLEYGAQSEPAGTGFDGTHGFDTTGQGQPPAYAPQQQLPDESGQYGGYDTAASYAPAQSADHQAQGYDDFATGTFPGYGPGGGQGQDTGSYSTYDTGQQSYAAYSDPYIGTQAYGGGGEYDSYGGQQQMYPGPYAENYPGETPPGGVWVPHQRDGEQPLAPEPPQQPAAHPHPTYDPNTQYRY